jgi:hypothetical protein
VWHRWAVLWPHQAPGACPPAVQRPRGESLRSDLTLIPSTVVMKPPDPRPSFADPFPVFSVVAKFGGMGLGMCQWWPSVDSCPFHVSLQCTGSVLVHPCGLWIRPRRWPLLMWSLGVLCIPFEFNVHSTSVEEHVLAVLAHFIRAGALD